MARRNSLWLACWPIYQVVWWWTGFLFLPRAGQRLGLSQELRLVGDLAIWWPGRQWYGPLNAVAIGVFLVNIAGAARMAADDR